MLAPRTKPVIDEATISLVKGHVRKFIAANPRLRSQQEDLVQEVSMYLFLNAEHFDASRGAWTTFVKCLANRKLISILRSEEGQRRRSGRIDSLERPVSGGEFRTLGESIAEGSSPRQASQSRRSAQSHIDLNEDMEAQVEQLDPELRDVCEVFMSEQTIQQTAVKLNKSRYIVGRRLEKIREIFVTCDMQDHRQ